jgi:hypothetical protein
VFALLMGWNSGVLASTVTMTPRLSYSGEVGHDSFFDGSVITFSPVTAGIFTQEVTAHGGIESLPFYNHAPIEGPKGENYYVQMDWWPPTVHILFWYGLDQYEADTLHINKITFTGKIEFKGAVLSQFSDTWTEKDLPMLQEYGDGNWVDANLGDNPFLVYWTGSQWLDYDYYLWEYWGQGLAWYDCFYSMTVEVTDLSAPAPLPPSLWLLGTGLLALAGIKRFRKS